MPAVLAVLRKCKKVLGFDRDGLTHFKLVDDHVLAVIGIICHGISAESDFHERKIFSCRAPHEGAESCLSKSLLRSEKHFLKSIVFLSHIITGYESSGFRIKDISAFAGDAKGKFIDCL